MNLFGNLCLVAFIGACFFAVGWGFVHAYHLLGYWKNRLLDGGGEAEARKQKVRKARNAFLSFWVAGVVIGGLGWWLGGWPVNQH